MSNKSDVCNIFLQFQKNVERLISSKIKIIQSDRGGEFRSPSKILQNIGIPIVSHVPIHTNKMVSKNASIAILLKLDTLSFQMLMFP